MNKLDTIYTTANRALLIATRIGTFLLVITMLLGVFSSLPVFADGGDGLDVVVTVFETLAEKFIDIILTLMTIVFAVGMVRSGFSMQAAQAFGLAGKVSNEAANMVGGILVFVLGMLTMSIVRAVVSQVNSIYTVNTDLSDITSGQ